MRGWINFTNKWASCLLTIRVDRVHQGQAGIARAGDINIAGGVQSNHGIGRPDTQARREFQGTRGIEFRDKRSINEASLDWIHDWKIRRSEPSSQEHISGSIDCHRCGCKLVVRVRVASKISRIEQRRAARIQFRQKGVRA